ncbi:MAG: UDP-N-acetylmuramoyl-tripeptide--D-alanyl-D-alanine ligase [Nitrospiraceae bacterium]|nr:MAG: UDP-N-acetylmuramoyl-tripeptide--D-alanyl-D-alanine ligase [Nitrospiraceae bacterium]
MALTADDIIKATGGELIAGDLKTFSGVSIDSRTIAEGEIFFALRGGRFDGHAFLKDALLKGDGAVTEFVPEILPQGKALVLVRDTLKALQDSAHYLRMKKEIPVIAVTGSNGKTTTKEMTYSILSKRFRTLKNEGNLNNHIGLPLSLMRLENDHEAAVLEMGMNAPGEIRRLCEIAVPTHGIITNIGSAHLGRLGSHNAVRSAKLEILHGLNVAVVNADDGFLMEGVTEAGKFNGDIFTFSIKNNAHVVAKKIEATEKGARFMLEFKEAESVTVNLNVHGTFNVYNALAAAAAGFSLGIPPEEIKGGLEAFSACSMRFEIKKIKGMTLINDSYNANPSSMDESLKEMKRMGGQGRTVAVLGDMGELDEFSEEAHKDIGRTIVETGIDVFIAVGRTMSLAAEECMKIKGKKTGPEIYTFGDADEAEKNITDVLKAGDTVLVKGSRAMKMEKIADRICDGEN